MNPIKWLWNLCLWGWAIAANRQCNSRLHPFSPRIPSGVPCTRHAHHAGKHRNDDVLMSYKQEW